MTLESSLPEYRVELDAFNGPLDLLLYLVRKNEIDLLDIPIARLTQQYLEHLKMLQRVDVDLAAEFLVMAATLLEIKSQMIVPQSQAADVNQAESSTVADTSVSDPRYELVQQLLAYKRFKDAALDLEHRQSDWSLRYPRLPARRTELDQEITEDPDAQDARPLDMEIEDLHIMDLCAAFAHILDTLGRGTAHHEIIYDDTPISLHAEDILDRLKREGSDKSLSLRDMIVGRSRSEAIGMFLALLELIRQRQVTVNQDANQLGADHIQVRILTDPASNEAIVDLAGQGMSDPASTPSDISRWIDPATGEIQYDWPSEDAKKAAERRARLRAKWLEKKKAGSKADGSEQADQAEEEDAPFIITDDDNDTPPPSNAK